MNDMMDKIQQKFIRAKTAYSHAKDAFIDTAKEEFGFLEGSQKTEIESLFDVYSLAKYLPDDMYDEENNIYVYGKASHIMFECTTLLGSSEETVDILSSILTDVLPVDSHLQVILWASPKIGHLIDEMERQRSLGGELLKSLASARAEFYKKGVYKSLFKEGNFILRDFRLFFCVSIARKSLDESSLVLRSLRDDISNNLKSVNILTIALSINEVTSLKREWLLPSRDLYLEDIHYDPNQEIRNQITDIEARLRVKTNQIEVIREESTEVIKCMSVRQYPAYAMQWKMGDLLGKLFNNALQINCPFLLSFTIHVKDKEKAIAALDAKYVDESQNAKQDFIRKWVKNFNKKYQEIEELRERLSGDDTLVDTYYTVLLYTTPENSARDTRRVKDLFRSNRFDLRTASGLQLQTLLSAQPFMSLEGLFDDYKTFGRIKPLTSFNAVNLMPITGEWKGVGRIAQIYPQRRGQFTSLYFFDNEIRNYNVVIVAPPGHGKSFLMNDYVQSFLSMGGLAYVIDVGGSYLKTCELVGGQLIDFNPDIPISLNPFSTIDPNSETAFDDAQTQLNQLLGIMARPSGEVSDEEKLHIEKAVQFMWKAHKNETTITKVAEYLKSLKDKTAINIGELLFPYTIDGRFGKYLEPPCTLNFDNKFVLFELGRLSNYKDFQKIVQKILIYQIANAMYFQSPNIPKTCLLDESYEFLADDQTGGLGHFINEGYRRAPKYGGNFITITHGMDDYAANPTAKMCYDNAYYKIFLGASQGTLDALKKAGRIDPYGEKLIRSLSITKEYSEFMMICGENQTVHRLIVDPFSRILNTTRKTEVVRVEQLTKSGMSLIDAISQVSKEVYGDK